MLSFRHIANSSSSLQPPLEVLSVGEKAAPRKRGESLDFPCHYVSFGGLKVSEELSISLSGEIRCPFRFINRANEGNLRVANESLWEWSCLHGFSENTPEHKAVFDKYNLVQFASYTVLNIPKPHISPLEMIREGRSISDIVSSIQETGTELDPTQLLRQSKYLLWLFRHDNWVETKKNITFISRVHKRCFEALNTGIAKPLTDTEYAALHNGPTKELQFVNSLILSMVDIGQDFNSAFNQHNFYHSYKYLGYEDFCQSVNRYFESQISEAKYRAMEQTIPIDISRRLRQEACGVYTVNYAALAECRVPIHKGAHPLTQAITRISEFFSALVCHFNDLISAPREINKPNWDNNELSLLMEEQEASASGKSIQERYDLVVSTLFKKVNSDLQNAFLEIDSITDSSSEEDVNDLLLPVLTYLAVIQEWAIGSMPAQMALDRYSKHREEGPYIKKGECMSGDSDFWRFAP